ncbi:MAG: putative dsRNA-binding protein, partial [Chloroflexi bacterium]|nr:putative dsRNA-binding protein [Chloroflexota bacterium]
YELAKTVVLHTLQPEMDRLEEARETDDFKSELQEAVQAMGFGPPAYHTVSQTGPDHAKEFTVEVMVGERRLAIGLGASKQTAEKEAARVALLLLRSVDPASGVRFL